MSQISRKIFFPILFPAIFLTASTLFAETTEIVTYYPTSGGSNEHVNDFTVGPGYLAENPADGVVLIETALGIGTNNPQEQLEITGNFRLPATTATTGMIRSGNDLFIHNFGTSNFFAGTNAGNLTMTGAGGNTGVGTAVLISNTLGNSNVAVGAASMLSNTTGGQNTAVGANSLRSNTFGVQNTAIGSSAMNGNVGGTSNVAVGVDSLNLNTNGDGNVAIGQNALFQNTTGDGNIAIGLGAGASATFGEDGLANVTGSNNVFIGASALPTLTNLTNAIAIGANARVSASNALVLGGTGANAVNVGIGVVNPTQTLHVAGTVRIVDGNQAAGRLLTSDANGVSSWQPPPSSMVLQGVQVGATQTFNNSGNSSVTQTVNLSGFAGATFVQLVSELESLSPSVVAAAAITFNFRNIGNTTILSFPFRILGGDVDTAFYRDATLVPIPSDATSIQIVLAGDNTKSREQAILRFYR